MYRHLSRFRLLRADLTGIPLLVAIGIGLLFLEGGMARAEEAPILEARVSKILDGDTFTLSGESRRIRVWGLDARECLKLCVSDPVHAVFRYGQASKRPANIMAS